MSDSIPADPTNVVKVFQMTNTHTWDRLIVYYKWQVDFQGLRV